MKNFLIYIPITILILNTEYSFDPRMGILVA